MDGSYRSPPFFFFNDTATTEIYTLSLHDALPICECVISSGLSHFAPVIRGRRTSGSYSRGRIARRSSATRRSEEHTSELQSPCNLVCRLLLEKKKTSTSSS